jgi:50S ribosomal protein L16 3-hydroxylase
MKNNWELNLDQESFLAQHWQQEPALIRNAIHGFTAPMSSNELAGLALEQDVESRIVECIDREWRVHHGPFQTTDFEREQPWTLLVQAVDHYIPQVAALRRLIDFIPQWRIDDIMVSYAVDGGSVGPHFDNYDVFLLQGTGERLWKIGQRCDHRSPLLPHDELRILENFETTEEHVLYPGDMLYIPPGIAHWGIAQSECSTFSIGFRAPRVTDMLSRWVDQLLEKLEPDQFYRDDKRAPVIRPGEIPAADVERALSQLNDTLRRSSGNQWFGELVTEPRHLASHDDDVTDISHALLEAKSQCVKLSPTAKLAWQHEGQVVWVYANGESRQFDESVLPDLLRLCEHWRLAAPDLQRALTDQGCVDLLNYLLEDGVVYVE